MPTLLRRPSRTVVLAGLLAVSACGRPAPEPQPEQTREQAPRQSATTLEAAAAAGLPNPREPIPGIVTGGQPSPDQYSDLAVAGFEVFVSLRPRTEDGAGWEEGPAGEGVTFRRIPIAGAGDLTRANVEALDRVLEAAAGAPTVVYCASGNRVGALLALRAYWLKGASPSEALELGRAAGLTRLEPAVAALLQEQG